MLLFHVDQRPVRARCEEILARVPVPGASDRDVRHDAAYAELFQNLRDIRLISGTTPEGVSRLLLAAWDTADPTVWRRSIARAIPLRGALRRGALIAAVAATVGIAVGLARISPWAVVAAVVLLAWIGVRLLRRFMDRRVGPVLDVARMEEAARAADRADDVEAVNTLYAKARQMIAEDRVPAGVGFRLANVLGAAAASTPFPVDLLSELRQLWLVAPEAEVTYAHVRDEIERRLHGRVDVLFGRIRRALRAGDTAEPLRAELRELARTAPGVTGARERQAEILGEIGRAGIDRDPSGPPDEILDEIEELIARLEAIDGGVSVRDGSPGELAGVLADIVARSTAAAARERADELRARIQVLPTRTPRRTPGRRPRPLEDLHAALAAIASADETRPRVLAAYRQLRAAADRAHERHQRDLVAAMRLTAIWARKHGDAELLGELRDDASSLVARGSIPDGTGAELAGVLRECARAPSIPTKLLDDFAALRAISPDVAAPHFWSIVDAAIESLDARLGEIAKTELIRVAAAFDETAVRARDPEIVVRARRLAARARALATSPSP